MRQETRLDRATVHLTDDGCYSVFHEDGSAWGAQPHATPHYDEIARRCGYFRRERRRRQETIAHYERDVAAPARMAYCREHEVFHHIVGAVFYGGHSPVLWALAHGLPITDQAAALEEAMVMTLQRWVRAGERPIIGGVDWDGLQLRALLVLDA